MGVKAKNLFFTVDLGSRYPSDIRQAIAQEVIDFVVKRTEHGIDKDGDPFPKYSKTYIKSLDFEIAGKSKSKVDLTLSGEMLNTMKYIEEKSNSKRLAIGYTLDDDVAGRVEGNVLGSYGGAPKPKTARNFLGITNEDLDRILKKYPIEDLEAARERADALNEGT